jgi:UDP-2,3-diacylglucosamine pyrophosphatase LpxH
MKTIQRYRTLFISDIHLGTRDAKTAYLKNFLENTECDQLYLVGDIFDLWKLKNGWHWPQINNDILRLVFHMASNGTRITYIPGNHDDMFRAYTGNCFNGVYVEREAIHHSANGRSYLVIHGDEFDCIMRHNKWLAYIGDGAYDFLLWLNHWFNAARRRLGFNYWSLSAFLKQQTKSAVNFIGNFEKLVCHEAERRDVTGIICGHIHHAVMQEIDGVEYKNSGDWVESCTALAEHDDGSFELLHWSEQSVILMREEHIGTANLSQPTHKAA